MVSKLTQALKESRMTDSDSRKGLSRYDADARNSCRLLGSGGHVERQEQGAKCKTEDFRLLTIACSLVLDACFHLITFSARTSGGMVSAICFAVLKSITQSNFVACLPGRSVVLSALASFIRIGCDTGTLVLDTSSYRKLH